MHIVTLLSMFQRMFQSSSCAAPKYLELLAHAVAATLRDVGYMMTSAPILDPFCACTPLAFSPCLSSLSVLADDACYRFPLTPVPVFNNA